VQKLGSQRADNPYARHAGMTDLMERRKSVSGQLDLKNLKRMAEELSRPLKTLYALKHDVAR
jgi:hypothetical protein